MQKKIFEGMTKGKQVTFNKETGKTTEVDSISPLTVFLSSPNFEEPSDLSFEDVWGNENTKGMMVARHEGTCPHFGDELMYKSYTFVCKKSEFEKVAYWLEYNLGSDCISKTKDIDGDLGLIAIRADYMCW